MLADWNAECSADDPTLVVPWHDAASGLHFVNLRDDPYALHDIAEVERAPALGRALRSLNAQRSAFLTAKCDAWPLGQNAGREAGHGEGHKGHGEGHGEERSADHGAGGYTAQDTLTRLALELDRAPEDSAFGFASYIDLLFRERSIFASRHQHQARLDLIARRAARLPHDDAALECILRPALLDLNSPLEGFGITLYLTAIAAEPETALRRWEAALDDTVKLLRSREFEPSRGSATIDAVVHQPGQQ